MARTLHILMVEDSALDAELTAARLANEGLRFEWLRVETEAEFRTHLANPSLDLVLSDYSLPNFTGLRALRIVRDVRPAIPFIVVSGALGEDNAVEMLKEGATDYVLKQRLERLANAVERAVVEARERAELKRMEEALAVLRKQAEEEREALLASERAARSEAERASQMKDQFLATLSHELRTPLNAIIGWAQILERGVNSAEDLAEGLAVIERNARVQARIVEDLLDMSRITAGKLRLDLQWVDVNNVIAAAMDSVRPTADVKGIQIFRQSDASGVLVRADPGRLQQIIWNLLTNAIKFTPRGGSVNIRAQKMASQLEISVSDTGLGIDNQFLPQVFDRFHQADASTTRRHGGLGLGLAIVRQLVEMHGGEVRAASDGLGKGATFTITLPVPSDTDGAMDGSDSGMPPGFVAQPLQGVRVLTVDDEPDARQLIRRILEGCGAQVLTAASAAEAMEVLRRERLNVLVSDIGMPHRDGYELLREVRSLPAERGGIVPAIALTAYARSEDRRRAMLAGFDMHVAKPVEPTQLCAMVARLAGRS